MLSARYKPRSTRRRPTPRALPSTCGSTDRGGRARGGGRGGGARAWTLGAVAAAAAASLLFLDPIGAVLLLGAAALGAAAVLGTIGVLPLTPSGGGLARVGVLRTGVKDNYLFGHNLSNSPMLVRNV